MGARIWGRYMNTANTHTHIYILRGPQDPTSNKFKWSYMSRRTTYVWFAELISLYTTFKYYIVSRNPEDSQQWIIKYSSRRWGSGASVGGVKTVGVRISRLSQLSGSCQLWYITPSLAPAEVVEGDIPLLWPVVTT